MTIDYLREDSVSFHRKLNAARRDIYTCDWEPDKAIRMAGAVVPYVSIAKMKRNIAPMLLKHGLDYNTEFHDLTQTTGSDGKSYWSVVCDFTLFDENTGCSMKSSAIGGYMGSDKGINICQTFAFKQVMTNLFMLIDGIEPEESSNDTGGFRKKTAEEVEEVKSTILDNPNVVKPKETPTIEQKPIAKAEQPSETPKDAPKETKPVEEPKNAPSEPTGLPNIELNGPQKNAITRIMKAALDKKNAGGITEEEFEAAYIDASKIASSKDASMFIKKYNGVF